MGSFTFKFILNKFGKQLDEKILDIQPIINKSNTYLVITGLGSIFELNTLLESIEHIYSMKNTEINFQEKVSLVISPNNRLISVFNSRGRNGTIIDLSMKKELMRFSRDDYHYDQTDFPIAFIEFNKRTLLVHGTKWNRLDISDPLTGELLTSRVDPELKIVNNEPISSEHYLDYFHGQLSVSPNNNWLIDNGWEWHPLGSVTSWNINEWIINNVWESEDGKSKKSLWWGKYDWNEPVCWISETEIGIVGRFDYDLVDEDDIHNYTSDLLFRIIDVRDGRELKRFNIDDGNLFFDEYLYCSSQDRGFKIYDIITGNEIYNENSINTKVYHSMSKEFLSIENNEIIICKLFKEEVCDNV